MQSLGRATETLFTYILQHLHIVLLHHHGA